MKNVLKDVYNVKMLYIVRNATIEIQLIDIWLMENVQIIAHKVYYYLNLLI